MQLYLLGLGTDAVCPLKHSYSPEFPCSFALLGQQPGSSPVTEGGHVGGERGRESARVTRKIRWCRHRKNMRRNAK